MTYCCTTEGTGRFFNREAPRSEKYFRKKGLRKEQKLLAHGIEASGIQRAEILEIGCGIGALHLTLLQRGAGSATGIDLSPDMIATAGKLAAEFGLRERAKYAQGDFVNMHAEAPQADVTVLDKVICCYEDAERLIQLSTGKTRGIYAVSYPRKSILVHLGFGAGILLAKLFRMSFRPFYHPPDLIEHWIRKQGFEKQHESRTFVWAIQVYDRKNGGH